MLRTMLALTLALLAGCASTPSAPSGNVRASCPEPLAVEATVRQWYTLCREAALTEHETLRKPK